MDSITYGTLLDVCASNNQCEEAEKYFKLMKDEGYTPNVFHYGSLINAYSVKGNYKKADELIVNMKDAGLVPNKVCFYVPFIHETDIIQAVRSSVAWFRGRSGMCYGIGYMKC